MPGGAGDEADKPCANRSARRGTCSGRAGNRCTKRRPQQGQRIRVSRVESAKDIAANKAEPAQSGWRAGEILQSEYRKAYSTPPCENCGGSITGRRWDLSVALATYAVVPPSIRGQSRQ